MEWLDLVLNWFADRFNDLVDYLYSLILTLIDALKDIILYAVDLLMMAAIYLIDSVGYLIDSLQIFAIGNYIGLVPPEIFDVMALIGLDIAIGIRVISLLISNILRLIPFIRLGGS